MRTRTVCGVSRGDPPLVVSWLKDGQPLAPALGVNVSALDPYSSLLSISSLAQRHSGDFTCVASNPAAEVRYTAKLQVKGNDIPACSSLTPPLTAQLTTHQPCLDLCRCFWHSWECVDDWNPSNVWFTRYCCTFFCSHHSLHHCSTYMITPHSL